MALLGFQVELRIKYDYLVFALQHANTLLVKFKLKCRNWFNQNQANKKISAVRTEGYFPYFKEYVTFKPHIPQT